jgi:predicted RNA-binding Zn-ribbon protein involved in translation (DUF1610 family)
MRGHIRHRGKASFEYIVDIGTASAQRCQGCGRRFWVERKPKQCCPNCGGDLAETEERRRAIKGGYATRKECQAALNKVLSAVEARTFTPPTRITVKAFLLDEWLPAVKGTLRPTTFASYTMLAREHIISRLGSLQLQKLSAPAINALYAYLLEEGRVCGKGGLSPSSVRRVHAVLHRACHDAVRWGRLTVNPVDAADPPKASAEHSDRLPVWTAEQLSAFLEESPGAPGADRLPSESPVSVPNCVRMASLGVPKGRFTSTNRPFCGPWASEKSCKTWDSEVPSAIDSLH